MPTPAAHPVGRVVGALGLFVSAFAGCEDGYPIAPSACDDWCLAVQRANCRDDRPAACVRDCEHEALGRIHPECEAEWLDLAACYRNLEPDSFSCIDGESQPDDDVCTTERVALGHCISERQGLCTEACIRERRACGESTWRCEPDCLGETAGCDPEQAAFHRCQLDTPVECDGSHPDASVEDNPCYREALEALDCTGYGKSE